MYKLQTTEKLIYLHKYQYLKEELQYIRTTGGVDVLWFECNDSRFIPEFICVDGKFIEIFVFQPKANRKPEHKNLFEDSGILAQGM